MQTIHLKVISFKEEAHDLKATNISSSYDNTEVSIDDLKKTTNKNRQTRSQVHFIFWGKMNNERISHFHFCAQNYHERKINYMWPN